MKFTRRRRRQSQERELIDDEREIGFSKRCWSWWLRWWWWRWRRRRRRRWRRMRRHNITTGLRRTTSRLLSVGNRSEAATARSATLRHRWNSKTNDKKNSGIENGERRPSNGQVNSTSLPAGRHRRRDACAKRISCPTWARPAVKRTNPLQTRHPARWCVYRRREISG